MRKKFVATAIVQRFKNMGTKKVNNNTDAAHVIISSLFTMN